ncbi:hypothetical protein M433DRAFT_481620 [Acidomyces richmondensis BFW]|nr:MAG: hypothetical protein FE78DRAFT_68698 [Acidomyces sp. 'richmondensis']KYG50240.1 hypothetical protein M433DRAFT_481620 [Acidomyces richmondensis BFW]
MRSFSTILATASLLAFTSALPEPIFGGRNGNPVRGGSCMTQAEAQQVADNFQNLIANYSDTLANESLTVGYQDYSDSVTTLIDSGCTGPQPLGAATFDSRASFEAGQGSQPAIPFEQLNVWYNCDNVFLRWRTALTPEFVTGIIVMETVPAPAGSKYPWLINTVYSEFNSGAWLVDLGVFVPSNCSSSSRRLLRA